MTTLDVRSHALVVVDAQVGFDDPWWGPRNNPSCDAHIASLAQAWSAAGLPLVHVRHDSRSPGSPLNPDQPGNRLQDYLPAEPDLLVVKQVNSAFHGTPDLAAWLSRAGIPGIVVCGITTNHCCETTARVGGNLGFDVLFALDATRTFDREGPDGIRLTADELARATATNLHDEFAQVVTTAQLLDAVAASRVGGGRDRVRNGASRRRRLPLRLADGAALWSSPGRPVPAPSAPALVAQGIEHRSPKAGVGSSNLPEGTASTHYRRGRKAELGTLPAHPPSSETISRATMAACSLTSSTSSPATSTGPAD